MLRSDSTVITLPIYKEPGFFTKTSLIQLGFGIWISLTEVAIGLAFGFSAVTIPQLQKNDSVFKVTTAENAWIASVLNLFAPIGCLVGGYFMDWFGRRFIMIVCEIPMAVGWLYSGLSKTALHVIVGRTITGMGIGLTITAARVYATEISLPTMRGVLGSLFNVFLSIGMTAQALLGSYLDWKTLCYIGAGYTTILCVANYFLPETPYYVLLKRTPEETRETLKSFRSKSYDINYEMINLSEFKQNYEIRKIICYAATQQASAISIKKSDSAFGRLPIRKKFRALFKKSACKPFWIMIPFILISQMSGITVITFYTVEILQDSKLSVDANAGNVMMGLTRLFSGIVAAFLIYKVNRRPLVICSCFSICVICLVLGVYLMFTEGRTVFPLICYILYITSSSVGLYTLMLLIMCELYPLQIRGILGGITISFFNFAIFAANTVFPYLKETIGLPHTIICFGISAFIGTIFLYFRLPETKGLTLEAIENFFSNGKQLAQQFRQSQTFSASDLPDEKKQVQESSTNTVLTPNNTDKNK